MNLTKTQKLLPQKALALKIYMKSCNNVS